ncbi:MULTISPECIES: HK97 family phage prohead protease [unclassified Mesorhizobium]|uniref:HK97 family phage prohead protease n=1 Tax=unclassified Mesorhizobium TaxID=325217 RepID=UPI0016761896|nr:MULTISPECIES: HK97 family phage prohead protease [unclassified Mesorhizobium]
MLVAGYACRYGVCTNDNFVVAAGAFTRLIERGFSPRMLFAHDGEDVGKWIKITQDEHGLFVVGEVVDSQVMVEVDAGRCRGLSLGRFVGVRKPIEGGVSLCVAISALPEISIVHRPGNLGALIEAICAGAC